jgi:uncharacterized membrane-anchored protein
MKTIHLFIIFLIVVVAQLFIPTQMILNQESVLKYGTLYKFKTQPMDPNDPFKGKYINLNYEIDTFKTPDSLWQRNETIYVYIETDSLGYAKIDQISRTILDDNKNDYFLAKAGWYSKFDYKLNIKIPFNRFYMEETKAYDAEVVTNRPQNTDSLLTTYALVYVNGGEAVLNDVLVDGMSIKDFVERESEKH